MTDSTIDLKPIIQHALGDAKEAVSGAPIEIKAYATAPILRNPTRVGDVTWPKWDQLTGRFTMLLPPAGLPPLPSHIRDEVLQTLRFPPLKHRTGRLQ